MNAEDAAAEHAAWAALERGEDLGSQEVQSRVSAAAEEEREATYRRGGRTEEQVRQCAASLLRQFDGDRDAAVDRASLKRSEYVHGRYPNEEEGRFWRAVTRALLPAD